jgi:hypothetical protein
MSLYEQFYSEINKKFMFNIIKDELKKEGLPDINEYYNEYLTFFDHIFETSDFDEIEMINKELLNYSITHFTNKLKSITDINSLLQQREEMMLNLNKSNPTDNSSSIINDLNLSQVNNDNLIMENIQEKVIHEPQKILKEPVQEMNEKTKIKNFAILSSKRSNINSSRYNYRIDLKKSLINPKMMTQVSKLIIPIEDNYIFDIPVITLSIPEFDFKIHMQQNSTIENKNKICGVYYPINDHFIENDKIDKITIDIRDITETKYPINDVLKINIIEIDKNTIVFTCSNIHKNNFTVGDNIKAINIHSNEKLKSILETPFKIKKIDKNIITCKIDKFYENEIFNDIDMKIMNMSNQNILYFN